MHYANGREARFGDKVVGKDCNGNPIGGVLIGGYPGAAACNGYIVPTNIVNHSQQIVSLSDCLHMDDAIPKG